MFKRSVSLLILCFVLSSLSYGQKLEYQLQTDSIIKDKTDKEKFDYLVHQYLNYANSDLKKAAFYANKMLALGIKNKDRNYLIDAYYSLGKIETKKRNLDNAITYFLKVLNESELLEKKKSLVVITECYMNLGIIYTTKENFKKAFYYHQKALNIAQKEHYSNSLIARIFNNISNIASLQNNYTDAIYYLKKSLELNTDDRQLAPFYINLGLNYINIEQYDNAKLYLEKGLNLSKQQNNKVYEAGTLYGFGVVYDSLKEYKKALQYHFKALKIEKELHLKNEILESYGSISTVYRNVNKLDSANYYFKKHHDLLNKNSSKAFAKNLKYNQATFFAEKKDYKKAYKLLKEHIKLKDSLLDVEINLKISEIKTKYETEKKEKEITYLKSQDLRKKLEVERKEKEILILKNKNQEQNNLLKTKELVAENKNKEIVLLNNIKEIQKIKIKVSQSKFEKQKTTRNLIIIGSILLFIPILFLLFMYKQKLQNQKLLALQKEKINFQEHREIIKNRKIIKMKSKIEGQLIERKRIAKELHDGLGGNLAGIKVRLMKVLKDNPEIKTMNNVITSIDDTSEEIRTISHDLIPPNMDNEKFTFLISKYVDKIALNQNWELDFNCHPEEELNKIPLYKKIEIYRIIQELVNNIRKYANTKKIDFQLIKHDDYINIFIEDYGKGFNLKTKSSGIGLQNIRDRVKILKGKIIIDTQLGRGTVVNIKIPD